MFLLKNEVFHLPLIAIKSKIIAFNDMRIVYLLLLVEDRFRHWHNYTIFIIFDTCTGRVDYSKKTSILFILAAKVLLYRPKTRW